MINTVSTHLLDILFCLSGPCTCMIGYQLTAKLCNKTILVVLYPQSNATCASLKQWLPAPVPFVVPPEI